VLNKTGPQSIHILRGVRQQQDEPGRFSICSRQAAVVQYKQLWRGGQVLAVPPAYTSQRCACCGHTAKENRLSQSKFVCQVCGYTANADVNGARNILAAGHAVLACGGMVQSGRPLKQEPEAEQSAVTH
ncbi:transposase, partial [Escherichia coli]|uniref:transposase n=1 Tax=Escherichia coli TaxID=562 RepID=UPI0020415A99